MDAPSPITSNVTPWRMSLMERGSTSSDSVAQLSMLMNPGATAMPVASISVGAAAADRSPMAAMVSAEMPMSARIGAVPDPS